MINLKNEVFKDTITIGGKSKEIVVNPVATNNMGLAMIDKLNNFEAKAWSKNHGGLDTGFPLLNEMFQEGLVPGFYVVAGDSNIGKSTFITQITYQILDLNEDVYIIDLSLDDPLEDKLSRLIGSWVKMDSNEVKFPKDREQDVIERRKLGIYKLANKSNNYIAFDTSFGNSIEKIEELVMQTKQELEAKGRKDTPMMLLIDSFHDLEIDSEPNLSETAKFNKIAKWIADLSIKENLITICTAELRKTEKNVRGTIGDIRESIKIRYEAKAIIMLYNDVHYNEDSAKIFFSGKDKEKKLPVLEAHIIKNKISANKGRLFYYMWASKGFLKECDEEVSKHYKSLI